MASQIQEGDIGTKLLVTITDDDVIVNISSASSLSIFIKKPDGSILTRSGTFETNGTDGKMYYTTVSGDINTSGSYKIQGRVTLSNGSFYTSTATFKVNRNL
jgi:hypothetical protein